MSYGRIGLLTFHWADNYGALLQAFGLKAWLSEHDADPFFIDYRPVRLRGRNWLVPYAPFDPVRLFWYALAGFVSHIRAGPEWFSQKRRMKRFRREYLDVGRGAPVPFRKLSRAGADTLIVGSDQIWSPDITFGLLPAYFGAFGDGRTRKVIAYGASTGGKLPERYEAEFGRLLDRVDLISTRESSTAELIRRRFGRKAETVLDPVFLPDADRWRSMARLPRERGYVLYHETEVNEDMREAARRLSEQKGLPVIALSYGKTVLRTPFRTVCSAGPPEFLGYVLGADYVITNSFHALAFSLIFHRPFLVYGHSSKGARTSDLLSALGLAGRNGGCADPDAGIDWNAADGILARMRASSEAFLLDALSGNGKGRA